MLFFSCVIFFEYFDLLCSICFGLYRCMDHVKKHIFKKRSIADLFWLDSLYFTVWIAKKISIFTLPSPIMLNEFWNWGTWKQLNKAWTILEKVHYILDMNTAIKLQHIVHFHAYPQMTAKIYPFDRNEHQVNVGPLLLLILFPCKFWSTFKWSAVINCLVAIGSIVDTHFKRVLSRGSLLW